MLIALCADGRSPHSQRWANGVVDRGHEVALVWIDEELAAADLSEFRPSISHHSYAPPALLGRPWKSPLPMREPRRLARQLRPNLVHGISLTVHGWTAQAFGIHPLVLTALGSDVFRLRRRKGGSPIRRAGDAFDVWRTRAAVAAADVVFADSMPLAVMVQEGVPGSATEIVRFGVEMETAPPSAGLVWRERLGIDAGAFVLLSSRVVRPHYNIDVIIRALPTIRRNLPGSVLILKDFPEFSDPGYVRFCLDLADELGVREAVHTVGELDRPELLELHAAADVYVSVPTTDGMAVSVFEAMAAGVPVVVSDVPGIDPTILRDGETALLVAPGDADALATAVSELDADRRRSLAVRALETVREFGDFEKELDRAVALYDELVAR